LLGLKPRESFKEEKKLVEALGDAGAPAANA